MVLSLSPQGDCPFLAKIYPEFYPEWRPAAVPVLAVPAAHAAARQGRILNRVRPSFFMFRSTSVEDYAGSLGISESKAEVVLLQHCEEIQHPYNSSARHHHLLVASPHTATCLESTSLLRRPKFVTLQSECVFHPQPDTQRGSHIPAYSDLWVPKQRILGYWPNPLQGILYERVTLQSFLFVW